MLFYAAACAVFAAVVGLYGLPVEAVGYAAALCAFLGVLFFLVGFLRFRAKHARLSALEREISLSADGLPPPSDLIERDYQALVLTLLADMREASDGMSARYADMTEYYTIWAHQVKTPLAALRLLLQNGEEGSPRGGEFEEELKRVEQYVEMVLCYLRLDAGSTDYIIREYELSDIVRQAVRDLASQFIRKKIRLEFEPFSCRVLTDEKWLLFVVGQVLSNALKYTKTGAIFISLEKPKTLCIRDTGIGIAPEDLPRVFEKGYTGYNGRSDKKASGIGLYLCRRICTKLGHRIGATSEEGEGTTVRIGLDSAPPVVE